jgi:Protein of unknown function (DUF3551)
MESPMRTSILSSGLLAAALMVGPQTAFAQAQEKAFCLEGQGGLRNCIYDSMAQCQQALGGRAGECITNPARSTTGAGGEMQRQQPGIVPPPLQGGGERQRQ